MDSILQKAKIWTQEPYDAQTRSEIQVLIDAENSKELENRFAKPVEFGTAGMRGILGAGIGYINEYTIMWVTYALSRYLLIEKKATNGIVLGYDGRKKSDIFARAASRVFLSQGIPVHFLDFVCPTPVIPFFVRNLKASAGVVITSSHNPPQYNGYKVYGENGAQIISPFDANVMRIMNEFQDPGQVIPLIGSQSSVRLNVLTPEDIRPYVNWAVQTAETQQGRDKKGIYTALHGAAGSVAASVFYKAGFRNMRSVPSQNEPDMRFPTVSAPNPENPENLTMAIEMAHEEGANLVLANDGDGDRIGLAWKDNDTFYIPNGNEIGTLLLYYLLKKRQEKNQFTGKEFVISTIVSTPLTKEICAHFQVQYHETLTGFKWMGNLAHELSCQGKNFLFAFEEAFGVTFGDSRDKDGITAILLAAHLNEETGFPALKEEMAKLFGRRMEGAIEKDFPGADGRQKMDSIIEKLRQNPPQHLGAFQVITIRDILKRTITSHGKTDSYTKLPRQNLLYFHLEKDGWVALRPSGTEPKLKIYFGINAGNSSMMAAQERLANLQTELMKILS